MKTQKKWQKLELFWALKKSRGSLTCQNFLKLCRLGLQDLTLKFVMVAKKSPSTSGFTADTIFFGLNLWFYSPNLNEKTLFFEFYFSAKILRIFCSFVSCAYNAISRHLKISDFGKFWKKFRKIFENFWNYFFRILQKNWVGISSLDFSDTL